jgi:hypothetical protein
LKRKMDLTQQIMLAVAPKITATLSIGGSAWIVGEVLVSSDKQRFVYHRLILAMAIYDILISIWYFASTWPMPDEHEASFAAKGSTSTCQVQGFFVQLHVASAIYFAMLGLYFWLVINHSYTEERLKRDRWELFFHVVPLVVSLGTAVAGVPLDLYHDADVWCWIAPSPSVSGDCGGNEDGETCLEPREAYIYRWAFMYGPIWICFLFVLSALRSVFQGVRLQEQRMKKYVTRPSITSYNGKVDESSYRDDDYSQPSTSNVSGCLQRRLDRISNYWQHFPRTRQVMAQTLCYVGAFFLANIFSTIYRVVQQRQGGDPPSPIFGLAVLEAFFQPLQGFLIFLAYRRPTYLRLRKQWPHKSRFFAIRQGLEWDRDRIVQTRSPSSLVGSRPFSAVFRQSLFSKARRNSDSDLELQQQQQQQQRNTHYPGIELPASISECSQENEDDHRPVLEHAGKSESTIATNRSSMTRNDFTGGMTRAELMGMTKEASTRLEEVLRSPDKSNDGGRLGKKRLQKLEMAQMQQVSMRFLDLVCMDIIPEVGDLEATRLLENLDENVIFEGSGGDEEEWTFEPHETELPREPSGRLKRSREIQEISDGNVDLSDEVSPVKFERKSPPRVTSGSSHSAGKSQKSSGSQTWATLAIEKKRKNMMQAIGRLSKRNVATEEEGSQQSQQVGNPSGSSSPVNEGHADERRGARQALMRAVSSLSRRNLRHNMSSSEEGSGRENSKSNLLKDEENVDAHGSGSNRTSSNEMSIRIEGSSLMTLRHSNLKPEGAGNRSIEEEDASSEDFSLGSHDSSTVVRPSSTSTAIRAKDSLASKSADGTASSSKAILLDSSDSAATSQSIAKTSSGDHSQAESIASISQSTDSESL